MRPFEGFQAILAIEKAGARIRQHFDFQKNLKETDASEGRSWNRSCSSSWAKMGLRNMYVEIREELYIEQDGIGPRERTERNGKQNGWWKRRIEQSAHSGFSDVSEHWLLFRSALEWPGKASEYLEGNRKRETQQKNDNKWTSIIFWFSDVSRSRHFSDFLIIRFVCFRPGSLDFPDSLFVRMIVFSNLRILFVFLKLLFFCRFSRIPNSVIFKICVFVNLSDFLMPRSPKGPQEPYKALKGLIRPSGALQGPQGPYQALKGHTRPSTAL